MICVFGGLSLTYGWNLFRVGVLNEQSAELSARGWRVNLKRVGPGAFFALFGCAVLAVSLRSPLSLSAAAMTETNANATAPAGSLKAVTQSAGTTVYDQGADPTVAKRWVASLNTILNVAKPDIFPSATEQKVIKRTDVDLEILRNELVIRQFGSPLFGEYMAYRKGVITHGTPGTAEQQKKFAEIDEWMESNRIQE
jgi:hypothetical protein